MRRKIQLWLAVIIVFAGAGWLFLRGPVWGDTATYPLLYEAEINAAAQEYSLDPALLFALIMSESRFRADVVSHAGAVGLAQLMPSTAAGVARKIGLTGFSTADLYNPAINARLGAAYLRMLLDQYNQDTRLALMAYNGGPGAANRYLRGGTLPRETNRYYQVVLERYESYQGALAQKAAATAAAQSAATVPGQSNPVTAPEPIPNGMKGVFIRWFGL